MTSLTPTCPRCKVPAIWDRKSVAVETETEIEWKAVRECRCCHTQVPVRMRRSPKHDDREALLQSLLKQG